MVTISGSDMKPLRPGDLAPDPTVTIDGTPMPLSAIRGDGQLLVTFLRHLM